MCPFQTWRPDRAGIRAEEEPFPNMAGTSDCFRRSARGWPSGRRTPTAFCRNRLHGGHAGGRRPPEIGRVAMTPDAAAPHARARARAQSRAFETRRRSVRPGRSLMRSRKVRGPAGGVRATEPHSPRGAGGGRAPLGLELRPWEENPHSPPAPGRGGGEETRASSRPRRGAPGSLPECRPPGPVLRPARCGLLPGLPGPPRSALRVSQAPVSDVT